MTGPRSTKVSKHKKFEKGQGSVKEVSRQPTFLGPQTDMLALHDAAGNRAVNQLLRSGPGDSLPAEALVPPIVGEVLRSPGQPLDPATRTFMESRFGHDFSQVRVHDNEEVAKALDAAAFTTGKDIFLAEGKYARQSPSRMALIAHELAHVIQQKQTSPGLIKPTVSAVTDPSEQHARTIAQSVVRGETVSVNSTGPISLIQRQETDSSALPEARTIHGIPNWDSDPFIQRVVHFLRTYAGDIGEAAIGFIPIVGDVYDAVTGIIGYSLLKLEKLDPLDRILSLIGLIPIPLITGKVLRLGKEAVDWILRKAGILPIAILKEYIPKAIAKIRQIWDQVFEILERRFGKRGRAAEAAAPPKTPMVEPAKARKAEVESEPIRPSISGLPSKATERGESILEIFAEGQRKASKSALEADIKAQQGIQITAKPGGKPMPREFDVGNFSHKYAEELIPESKLPRGLEKEFKVELPGGGTKRIDRLDRANGKFYEIKPDTPSQVKAGQDQAKIYEEYLNREFPLGEGRKWKGEVVTYDRNAVSQLLKKIGWIE